MGYHSLRSKEWEPYGSENRNKKAPKPQKASVQTHLCTRIRSAGKAGEKIGTEYPDSVCGAKAHSFRKAFPGFTRVTGAPAPIGKNIHLTVPFLRRGFTPRFSVLAQIPREPCSCMPIFICKLIMNLFVRFVNIFTQKNSKNSKNGSAPPGAHFEHAFSPLCSCCSGKMRHLSTK